MNPNTFHDEGRLQLQCAACGATGPYHVHHVVSKQRLKHDHHFEFLYDPRNALRLCKGLETDQCHMEHENCNLLIETEKLTDDNICFIFEILRAGPGHNLLVRDYSGPDARFALHLEGECPLCQPKRQ